MNDYETLKERIMEMVTSAPNQRMRPTEISRRLSKESGVSRSLTREVLKHVVEEEDLVYVYRDPNSYVEFPCNGCEGSHKAARPMKVVIDSSGNPWLCDEGVQGRDNLAGKECWDCGSLPFTRT
jgi:hypothetical protein